jgi:hypothetical protein
VGPIPRDSATRQARSQNPRLAKLLSGFLLLSSISFFNQQEHSAFPDSSSSVRKKKTNKNEERRKKGLENSPAPQLL